MPSLSLHRFISLLLSKQINKPFQRVLLQGTQGSYASCWQGIFGVLACYNHVLKAVAFDFFLAAAVLLFVPYMASDRMRKKL